MVEIGPNPELSSQCLRRAVSHKESLDERHTYDGNPDTLLPGSTRPEFLNGDDRKGRTGTFL